MKKINILVLAEHEGILETILRLINNYEEWEGVGASNVREVMKTCKTGHIDLVLLGVGVRDEDEIELRQFFDKNFPQIICVRHYGGGSGLLFSEIKFALSSKT